jgi:hypothetical protein
MAAALAAGELHGPAGEIPRRPPSARVGTAVCAGGGRGGRAASVAQADGSSSCRRAAPSMLGAPWPARRTREAEPTVFPSSPSLRLPCFASTAPRGRRRQRRAVAGSSRGTSLPAREGAWRGTRGPARMSSLLDCAFFSVDPRRRENEGGAPVHRCRGVLFHILLQSVFQKTSAGGLRPAASPLPRT